MLHGMSRSHFFAVYTEQTLDFTKTAWQKNSCCFQEFRFQSGSVSQ
jgi:hypothetical protein